MLVWHLKYEVCHQKICLIFLDNIFKNMFENIFIGPDSNHWPPLSLSLTPWCLSDLIDVTPAFEDANSKLVEVVNVDDEDRLDDSLLQT